MRIQVLSTIFFLAIGVFCMDANADPTTRPATGTVLRLWEDRAPRSTGDEPKDIPEMTAYFPDAAKANGCAVVICPGGGYSSLAIQKEGTDVAAWLNDHGVA